MIQPEVKDTHKHAGQHKVQMVFSAWGFFFNYSIKVLAFYSFSEAAVLELGQSKHSDVCGGWIDVCLVDEQLIWWFNWLDLRVLSLQGTVTHS